MDPPGYSTLQARSGDVALDAMLGGDGQKDSTTTISVLRDSVVTKILESRMSLDKAKDTAVYDSDTKRACSTPDFVDYGASQTCYS